VQTDEMLRRIGRTAVLVCLAMTAVAFVLFLRRWAIPLAVLGGGVLAGASFVAIRSGVGGLVGRIVARESDAPRPPHAALTLIKLAGRYALLAFLAYVMIARLSLHPLGLLAGASSVVAAVSIEALRLLMKKSS